MYLPLQLVSFAPLSIDLALDLLGQLQLVYLP